MIAGGDLFLLRNGDEAIASIEGDLASLQGVQKGLTYGGHEQHVSMLIDNKTEQRKGHNANIARDDPLVHKEEKE